MLAYQFQKPPLYLYLAVVHLKLPLLPFPGLQISRALRRPDKATEVGSITSFLPHCSGPFCAQPTPRHRRPKQTSEDPFCSLQKPTLLAKKYKLDHWNPSWHHLDDVPMNSLAKLYPPKTPKAFSALGTTKLSGKRQFSCISLSILQLVSCFNCHFRFTGSMENKTMTNWPYT